jgi:hypothetical protein
MSVRCLPLVFVMPRDGVEHELRIVAPPICRPQ